MRFSLKILLLIVVVAATAIYNFPLAAKVYCDYRHLGDVTTSHNTCCRREGPDIAALPALQCEFVNIHGRNENQPFTLVLEKVKLSSVEPSETPALGELRLTCCVSLRAMAKLKKFAILRAEPYVE